jgi:hypothetical protein
MPAAGRWCGHQGPVPSGTPSAGRDDRRELAPLAWPDRSNWGGASSRHCRVEHSTPKVALRRRHRTQVPKLRADGVELAINPILAGPDWRLGWSNSAAMANQISTNSSPRFGAHRRWLPPSGAGWWRPVPLGHTLDAAMKLVFLGQIAILVTSDRLGCHTPYKGPGASFICFGTGRRTSAASLSSRRPS